MMRSLTSFAVVLGSLVLTGAAAKPAFAQWDFWLLEPSYRTSYYPPSYYGGYWTGYAPSGACNNCGCGPAPAWDCGCASACSPCGSGGCASGSCGMNAAPGGAARPIPDPDLNRSGTETNVPGKPRGGSNNSTFDPNDPRSFDPPTTGGSRPGTGTGTGDAPRPKPFGSGRGTGNTPADDGFRSRPGTGSSGTGTGTGTGSGLGTELEGNPDDPFTNKANKVELNDPDLPKVPDKSPAAPMDVKEDTPVDAQKALDGMMTNRPVIIRERQAMRSHFSAPSLARTPARPTMNWSATPVDARIARQ